VPDEPGCKRWRFWLIGAAPVRTHVAVRGLLRCR
jgi:hypothetical protein